MFAPWEGLGQNEKRSSSECRILINGLCLLLNQIISYNYGSFIEKRKTHGKDMYKVAQKSLITLVFIGGKNPATEFRITC